MPLFRNSPTFPRDPLFRAVLMACVVGALLSLGIALLAEHRWNEPVLAEVASISALICLFGYVGIRVLGMRRGEGDSYSETNDKKPPRDDREP